MVDEYLLFFSPESRFLELIPREESEDLEGAVPRLILKRQNTPSDDSTPPKVCNPEYKNLFFLNYSINLSLYMYIYE